MAILEQDPLIIKKDSAPFIERLHLDEMAQQMALINAMMGESVLSNGTQIEVVKAALSCGEYQIQTKRIAAKLLEHAELKKEELAETA